MRGRCSRRSTRSQPLFRLSQTSFGIKVPQLAHLNQGVATCRQLALKRYAILIGGRSACWGEAAALAKLQYRRCWPAEYVQTRCRWPGAITKGVPTGDD